MTEQNTRRMLAAVLALVVINLAYTFFSLNSNLSTAIRKLEQTRDTIAAAVSSVQIATLTISHVQEQLDRLEQKAGLSELEVRILNQQIRMKQERSKAIVDSLQKEITKNLDKLNNL